MMTLSQMRLGLHGIFPVLKPYGVTSAKLLDHIKKKLSKEFELSSKSPLKMGHGGTLDSTATGVLVVGIGNDCKLLRNFLECKKSYLVKGQLGVATDTYNEIGQIMLEKSYDHVTHNVLHERLQEFEGRIKQKPPIYSAIKKGGVRYSDLARKGVDIQLKPRWVHCYELELSEFTPPNFTITVLSGAGFYVRSLVHDLGLAVGSCAHVRELMRTRQGPFHMSDALQEHQWTPDHIYKSITKSRCKMQSFLSN